MEKDRGTLAIARTARQREQVRNPLHDVLTPALSQRAREIA
jgi:hypothetical protein